MVADPNSKAQRIQALRMDFQSGLENRLRDIQAACAHAISEGPQAFAPDGSLRRLVHNLSGSAGTFGLRQLSEQARRLEQEVVDLSSRTKLAPSDQATLETHLSELHRLAAAGPEEQPEVDDRPPSLQAVSTLVHVLEDDPELAGEIALQLAHFGYKVSAFPDFPKLARALSQENPAVLLANIHLLEGERAGSRIISELNHLSRLACPVVFFSPDDHWQVHLAAIRAGGKAFFSMPLDFTALVGRLDQLTGRFQDAAVRVLIVEDDEWQSEHYALVLSEAGMLVETVSEPADLPRRLSTFGPDLILMDIFLPGCTGIEAATIIRQIPAFTHMPIVYLSALDSREGQLSALQAGGDEFLQKPISDSHLVSAIKIRADRFRALNALMSRDGLTGLLNHINLKLALERELANVQRRDGSLSLAMIDLDRFKVINDQYGHPIGDKVLKGFARLLSERLRKGDFAARYGGEEFVVVMPDTHPISARQVLEELRTRFASLLHFHDSGEFTATFSAGIASTPPHLDMDALLRAADQALYRAKHRGRNRVECETPAP